MRHLSVAVAGTIFQIRSPSKTWNQLVRSQYAAFLTDNPFAWQIDLRHDPTLSSIEQGWVDRQGGIVNFRLLTYRGQIDFTRKCAEVYAPALGRGISALDRILSYILTYALPREQNALLLHAAGIAIQGRGLVFFGASGAGKTTIATLAPSWGEVFSDENVILSCSTPQPQLHSTPFWGHSTPMHLVQRTRQQAPLHALYALRHGPDFRLEPMYSAESVVALLATEKVAADHTESMTVWLAVVDTLLAMVPVYMLTFRPTPDIWPFLRSRGHLDGKSGVQTVHTDTD